MPKVKIESIQRDFELQSRVEMDNTLIEEYADNYRRKVKMPPVDLLQDPDGRYWPWDGNHRIAGAERADCAEIDANVRKGTKRDAILLACGANETHGKRRTQGDRWKAVCRLLEDPEWSKLTDRQLCDAAKVSHGYFHQAKLQWEDLKAREDRGEVVEDPGKVNWSGRRTRRQEPVEDRQEPEAMPGAGTAVDEFDGEPLGSLPAPGNEEAAAGDSGWIPEAVLDGLNVPVPEHLAEVFQQVENLGKANASLCAALRLVEVAAEGKAGHYLRRHLASIRADVENAKRAIKIGIPYAVCPLCKGQGCLSQNGLCYGAGFIVKDAFDKLEKRLQDWCRNREKADPSRKVA